MVEKRTHSLGDLYESTLVCISNETNSKLLFIVTICKKVHNSDHNIVIKVDLLEIEIFYRM